MALYPPIVASSMPAFNIQDKKVRIYYSLSTYNVAKKDDIQSVHITVRNQASNVNVLVNPNEMIEKSFGLQDDVDKVLNRYYIDIADEDISLINTLTVGNHDLSLNIDSNFLQSLRNVENLSLGLNYNSNFKM